MGTMRQKYINAIFLAHCFTFGLTPYFMGPSRACGYPELATVLDIERFKTRRHGVTGKLLRREQKNNQQYLYGGISSFHESINFRLTEYAVANRAKGVEKIGLVFRLCHMTAYEAISSRGTEVATGAGGKNRMPGLPIFLAVTHAVNHDGTPGWHTHVLSNGMAADEHGKPRVMRNKEILYAQDRAYQIAFQAAFAHYAKEHLGFKHVTFNGTHAVDPTVDHAMCRDVGIGARREKILAWMAERNWDIVKQGKLVPNLATRDRSTQQFTLEDRLKTWGPLVEKAIAGYEQRTGRAWDRVPGPGAKPEADGAKPAQEKQRPEPPKVEAPRQSAKINIDAYSQPKEVKPEPKPQQEPKVEEPKKSTKPEAPKWESVAPGTRLMAHDVTPPNYGHAVADMGDRVKVHFVSPQTKAEKTATIGKDKLMHPDGRTLEAKPAAAQQQQGQAAQQQQQAAAEGPKKSRAEQRLENMRQEYIEGLDRSLVDKLRRSVKARLKVFQLLRAKRSRTDERRDPIKIDSREKLDQTLFDLSKRPRWLVRQRVRAVVKRNFFKMNPHQLAVLAKKTFREERKPTIRLRNTDRITVSPEVAATLTTGELRGLLRAIRGTGARLHIPGKKADIRRIAAQNRRQRRHDQHHSR